MSMVVWWSLFPAEIVQQDRVVQCRGGIPEWEKNIQGGSDDGQPRSDVILISVVFWKKSTKETQSQLF